MTDRPVGPVVANFSTPPVPGPELSGRYVTLELLQPERHAEALFHANQGSDWVWDYMPYGPFTDLSEYRAWQQAVAEKSDPFFYAMRDKATCRIGGVASFLRIDPANGVIEIGHIQIAPELQRGAASTEAILLMIGWAFEAGYRRVEWKCNALNKPSMLAARRYGFTYEGTFRQHLLVKGRNRDSAWFSVLDGEWPALRDAYAQWLDPQNFAADGTQIRRLSELTESALQGR
ncbi:GNAT family N-acetyltransferase [Paracoccus aestuariivivens]|uniref:GNAT family N-acetyltransferase n=1 Tax=Paracoccus aestuariivivens TaxID=1820333 RepID=A0A6L6J635_9RHOB|nr:GNAT family protein [Paracoccus aestuariivivens]MTH76189.1 GNAT family N-acetyltransferase [Paracoccus aestuariivivens]